MRLAADIEAELLNFYFVVARYVGLVGPIAVGSKHGIEPRQRLLFLGKREGTLALSGSVRLVKLLDGLLHIDQRVGRSFGKQGLIFGKALHNVAPFGNFFGGFELGQRQHRKQRTTHGSKG